MIVYHGSTEIIKSPDVLHSFRTLDFGKGFYLTTNREQAERWARRKADLTLYVQRVCEIKAYPEYDQIAFITQESIDKLLVFKSVDEV